eukprot:CAMPEP_0178408692 /NCGR_PEP_ID=MMETSP0689_2-20121128/20074_1 /TAXON_ID=160604 /ORGANISM="Amphidinium massartii, Strain CS-259" /LENGTH=313 /DNA_ID=CAMNT_0020029803 /DNA_START=58 /DNA_END=996 /DNA_ORIENTATION=-
MSSGEAPPNDPFMTSSSRVPSQRQPFVNGKGRSGRAKDLLVGWLPIPIFLVCSIAFTVFWPFAPSLPCILALVAVLWSSFAHSMYTSKLREYHGQAHLRTELAGLVFVTSLLAVAVGTLTGLYAAEQHTRAFFAAEFGQAYSDVGANESGAAYQDAGEIQFTSTAFADGELSLGFKDHHTYCVAPILDSDVEVEKVHFWAIGFDCCDPRGGFQCGGEAAGEPGGGGLRLEPDDGLLGKYGLFGRPREREFREAVKQAAAVYSLSVPAEEDLVLVQWVRSASAEQVHRVGYALATIAIGAALFLLMVIVLSIVY